MNELNDAFVREMGLSHREFFRTLPSAVGDDAYSVNGNSVTVTLKNGRLILTLAPETVRRIASIEIPKTLVSFSFESVPPDEKQRFLHYFDKRFQRGGG